MCMFNLQGNECFKQKKYLEAIDCYSRSIALSPTSVAFANRAMAYIKLKRYEEAESDCTEALNLDDRYVKAYSRRATARKELGKFKASIEDSEFAISLEPNNVELRKQYTEARELLEKEISKKHSGPSKSSGQGIKRANILDAAMKGVQDLPSVSSTAAMASATSVQTGNVDTTSGKAFSKPLIAANKVDSKGTSKEIESRDLMNGSHGTVASSSIDGGVNVQEGVIRRKQDLDASIQNLASRAASRVMQPL
ncbi:uncharacterized protein A4U43_C05F1730 [Asparagus officinalis]|uniref:RNA-polymerase II-associated protein 3-like C-terminal domain-containing protein n=1 Tax=Asparagus officinalis TaxID=4686 RepID=A0A5P1ENU1_ASPOF|nr:uncharacterized protein A4U43_C05F1730 [Asparagus officinalis]